MFGLSLVHTILISAAASFVLGFGSGWKITANHYAGKERDALEKHIEEVAQKDRERKALQDKFQKEAKEYDKQISAVRAQKERVRVITKVREYAKDPNTKCPTPPKWVRGYNGQNADLIKTRHSQ